ncbi:unnamed protein product [marine sediment metagenome]|uniref:Uncharacterized protein n=1 Tax=marine sediment metagenome TaxID=412755 RepID=X1M482_9ZZZZ
MDSLDRVLSWLPQNPLLGPPLPVWMNVFWPEPVKPALPPKRGTLSRDVDLGYGRVIPLRKYVTRVTVRKARKAK